MSFPVASLLAFLLLSLSPAFAATAAGIVPPQPEADKPPVLVAFGDSLTAGYGLGPEQAFPARLQAYLAAAGIRLRIENAGVSGDTTAGGRARLGWVLADKPQFVLLELGANDALRGLDPLAAEANLDAILSELQSQHIPVLFCGMLAPPNLGRDYTEAFDAIYPRLAKKYAVPLYPFFLDGVVMDAALMQPDRLHPNPAGVDEIVRRIAPYVVRLVTAGGAGAGK